MAALQILEFTAFGSYNDDERLLGRLSGDERAIEQERLYTYSARALETAMLDRGPAGSLDFWASVKALYEVSKAEFIPHFVINRVHLIEHRTQWELDIGQHSLDSEIAPEGNANGNSLIDAKRNFRKIVTQIRSPAFTISDELLALGAQASESLQSRKGEDIDEWTSKLGEDIS